LILLVGKLLDDSSDFWVFLDERANHMHGEKSSPLYVVGGASVVNTGPVVKKFLKCAPRTWVIPDSEHPDLDARSSNRNGHMFEELRALSHSDYSQAVKKGALNLVFQTLKIGRMMRSRAGS